MRMLLKMVHVDFTSHYFLYFHYDSYYHLGWLTISTRFAIFSRFDHALMWHRCPKMSLLDSRPNLFWLELLLHTHTLPSLKHESLKFREFLSFVFLLSMSFKESLRLVQRWLPIWICLLATLLLIHPTGSLPICTFSSAPDFHHKCANQNSKRYHFVISPEMNQGESFVVVRVWCWTKLAPMQPAVLVH